MVSLFFPGAGYMSCEWIVSLWQASGIFDEKSGVIYLCKVIDKPKDGLQRHFL